MRPPLPPQQRFRRHAASLRAAALSISLLVTGCASATPAASSDIIALPVVPALPGDTLPPLAGGTLFVTRAGLIVAGDPDHASVWVVDPEPGATRVVGRVALADGDEPGRMTEDATGRVHIVLRGAGELLTIDPAEPAELYRRDVCAAPRGVTWDTDPDRPGRVWVACAGGELVELTADGGIERRFVVERDLRDVVATVDGLFVSLFRRAELLTIDRTSGATLERRRPEPQGLPTINGDILGASVAWRLQPAIQGGVIMLHQRAVISEVDVDGDGYAGLHCRNGVVSPGITHFPPRGQDLQSTGPLGFAPLPLDVVELEHDRLVVAIGASPGAGQNGDWSTLEVPLTRGPWPCAPLRFPTAGAPPAVAVAKWRGHLVTQHRDPTRIAVQGGAVFEMEHPMTDDLGHTLFHAGTPSFVACASCHPEGGEDGHTWSFTGIGLRRTQSLRGGLLDTAPFHWSGDQPGMRAIMIGSFERRMGGPPPSNEDIDAVGAWLDGLPSLDPPTPTLAEAEAAGRGEAHFLDPTTGCATCHAGVATTSSNNEDVGTGGGALQVPSLRGVRDRAPYFYNGCATSLADVVAGACGTLDLHGTTSQLTAADRADLVAYLNTL